MTTTRGTHVRDRCDRCGKLRRTVAHNHTPDDTWRFVRTAGGRICRTCNTDLNKATATP